MRRPRPTVRLRLTLLYGGLFLLSGGLLIGLVYLLVAYGPLDGRPPAPPGLPALDLPAPDLPPWMRSAADAQRAADLGRLVAASTLAFVVTAAVSLGLGWLVAGRVLRPLTTMTETVRRISADDLARRLAATGPDDELTELADTFDALLDRLSAAFAAQRRFVAHASHELRTPLALQRAVVEVALADPDADPDALRAAMHRVIRSGEEQDRLIEALLTLARGEQGLAHREPVDLAGLARAALDRPDADRIDADLGPCVVAGDPELLGRLVSNLLDNALRHHVPDGRATLVVRAGTIRVANPGGRAVRPDQVDELLEPFGRLAGPDGPPGLGLGLPIVAAIVRAHGGRLRVRPLDAGGLDVTAELPTR